jgi:hypothetical protein
VSQTNVATHKCRQERVQETFKRSALVMLVILSSLIFVVPGLAQNKGWRIDSEHSTARLFMASSRNPDAAVNVGVARTNGLVTRNADSSAMADFDFTIYPADKTGLWNSSKQRPNNKKPANDPDCTVITFESTRVVRVDKDAFRVTGNLTLTYVERLATYDPSEAYSGPVYGQAVTSSLKEEVVFTFHQLNPPGVRAAEKADAHWSAFSTISGESFPELLNAVSTTDWPTFVADEHCVMPSSVGEDFAGPACTGEVVEPTPRRDLHCEMPPTVGEDYAGEVCTQTSSPAVITDARENKWEARRHKNGEPTQLVANEVKIQLDLRLTEINSPAADSSGK